MRTAVISDIHGNLVALGAVLEVLGRERVDQIVCLGDIAATGPQPTQTTEMLMTIGCPVVLGNTDEWLLNPRAGADADASGRRVDEIDLWCAEQLGSAHLDFLRTLPIVTEVSLGGGATMLCFHGSPRDNTEVILATTPDEQLGRMLGGADATVMAGGHTHVQMLRRLGATTIINPGTVGRPFGRHRPRHRQSHAEYAVITSGDGGLGIDLRRTPVDLRRVVEVTLASGMPHADWWLEMWNQDVSPLAYRRI